MEKKKSCHVSRGLSGFSILEALFGGWLLIREDILRIFRLCKDVEYALLRYLLEDLVPLVIFFYSTIIRGSHYEEWQLAIICLSIMLITQKRRHYNKSMLAAISDFMHYEVVIPEWQTVFANHLNVFTEKKVEDGQTSLLPLRTDRVLRWKLFCARGAPLFKLQRSRRHCENVREKSDKETEESRNTRFRLLMWERDEAKQSGRSSRAPSSIRLSR